MIQEQSGRGPRIRAVRITPIAIQDPPLLNAAGLHAPFALRTVVELETEDGVIGISEIPGNEATNQALEEASRLVIGKDLYQLNKLQKELEAYFGKDSVTDRGDAPWDQRKLVHVFSALEVACLDCIGKLVNRPVVDLLGGRMRDSVPFAAYLFFKYEGAGGDWGFSKDPGARGWDAARQEAAVDPQGIVNQAIAMCKEYGFQSIKLKGGAFEPELEVACMQALYREFGPAMPLRFDPNAIWKPETGLKYGKVMEPILEYLEDPVRGQENMAWLRGQIKTPLATNMCTTSFDEIPSSIRLGSEDIILSDHHFWGGLRASMELSRVCNVFGRDLSMHSNSHLGISLAAMVHLGAALPQLRYALDTHYPWQSEEIITGGRLAFDNGAVHVPSGPGLGVELDRDSLQTLHQNYLKCGLKKRDDQVEMQKVHPDWTFQKIRW
ncbi:glucarate dehydratase [Cyclobacterium xiamenense]|uniref:glucarate dehydratase n=1 Tax=Cyclobacterium xiamenense TaxID=1297121 RepID=A0A1H6UVD2_9BACT|nr:enolase C-terminal domain-like protein [Cyclobacterium xiamenense]SEI91912.1 glucarate dehydratase [Cyclobacterium xiamenense]